MQETQHTEQITTRTAQNQDIETVWMLTNIKTQKTHKYTKQTFIKGYIGVPHWNGQRRMPLWGLNQVYERSTSPSQVCEIYPINIT